MNTIRTVVLLTVLTLGLVFIGGMIGGRGGALFALIMAGVMNMGSYWFSDKIVIKMYRGNQVTSGPLFDVVNEICQLNQLPMPKVYSLPQSTPNAFATGRNPENAVVAAGCKPWASAAGWSGRSQRQHRKADRWSPGYLYTS